MADEQLTTFRALRDGFHAAARHQIERLLEASTAPETRIRPAVPARWNMAADPLNHPVADSPADEPRALAHVQTGRRRGAWAWVHGAICLAGVAITIGTFEAAYQNNGGTYLVYWGAIIFGAINCARSPITPALWPVSLTLIRTLATAGRSTTLYSPSSNSGPPQSCGDLAAPARANQHA